ncbi:MAG: hypothetical protein ABIE70_08570 [bacterium]
MFRCAAMVTAIAVMFMSVLLTGCGSKEADEKAAAITTAVTAPPAPAREVDFSKYGEHAADAQEIYAVIVDVIERLRYDDKTGLYENEFEYFRNEKTFDDYLLHGEVTWANADSLDHVVVKDITFFDRDSAWIEADFMMQRATGGLAASPIRLPAYYHQGRWIKPYMSRMSLQLEFEEKIRQADQDAGEDW